MSAFAAVPPLEANAGSDLRLTRHEPLRLHVVRQRRTIQLVLTIYETPTFVAEAAKIWSTEERLEFFYWLAQDPDAGTVIPGSGGCRKVRWSRPGMGKQGGARVIYFTRLEAGELCMLLVYPKAVKDNIPGHILKEIRKEIEDENA
jgi:hypothetical protein